MTYSLELSKKLDRKFAKMARKEKHRLEIIWKKVGEIRENPNHYKPLRGDLHGRRRVHIDSSFVLIYRVDEEHQAVRLLEFEHHDKAY